VTRYQFLAKNISITAVDNSDPLKGVLLGELGAIIGNEAGRAMGGTVGNAMGVVVGKVVSTVTGDMVWEMVGDEILGIAVVSTGDATAPYALWPTGAISVSAMIEAAGTGVDGRFDSALLMAPTATVSSDTAL
jgi:hypothetical protein